MNVIFSGYLLSKEEGQPGTPEKPLSDLGKVSYYAYWKSVVLEYLNAHRTEKLKLTDVSRETGMYCQDIALALELLGFIKYMPTDDGHRPFICVDWAKVDSHAQRVSKSKTRIPIDHECLRWTPLLNTTVNPFREPKSDEEKEHSLTETADIVVPMPEKIIIETQQGVKLKRGKKRKISTAPPRTPKTPKLPVVVPVESNENTEEVEITSSGRKRTRPSKFNETTYADVKHKNSSDVTGKRKRNDSVVNGKECETDKKRMKVDIPSKSETAPVKVETTPNETRTPRRGTTKVVEETPKKPLEVRFFFILYYFVLVYLFLDGGGNDDSQN